MYDRPDPALIEAEVARAAAEGSPPSDFAAKVVANATAIAQRQRAAWPDAAKAEAERLAALGFTGSLKEANRALCDAIRAGAWQADSALVEHLIATTIAKLEVDQPTYPAFRHWRGEAG